MTTLSLSNLPASLNAKAKAAHSTANAYRYETMCGRYAVAVDGHRADLRRAFAYVTAYAAKLGYQVDNVRWTDRQVVICLVDQGG